MTATGITATSKPARRRVVNVVLWVAQIGLAAFFVFASAPKLLGDPTAVAMFHVIGFGEWFRYLTGACELAGAIGLLIPRLSGVAATGLVGLMIGASLTNLFLLPGMASTAAVTVLLGVVFAVIAWARRDRTVALAATARRLVGSTR
ncbi:MAG TPA: DoxX family protein [Streptosporangiales bacterium]